MATKTHNWPRLIAAAALDRSADAVKADAVAEVREHMANRSTPGTRRLTVRIIESESGVSRSVADRYMFAASLAVAAPTGSIEGCAAFLDSLKRGPIPTGWRDAARAVVEPRTWAEWADTLADDIAEERHSRRVVDAAAMVASGAVDADTARAALASALATVEEPLAAVVDAVEPSAPAEDLPVVDLTAGGPEGVAAESPASPAPSTTVVVDVPRGDSAEAPADAPASVPTVEPVDVPTVPVVDVVDVTPAAEEPPAADPADDALAIVDRILRLADAQGWDVADTLGWVATFIPTHPRFGIAPTADEAAGIMATVAGALSGILPAEVVEEVTAA